MGRKGSRGAQPGPAVAGRPAGLVETAFAKLKAGRNKEAANLAKRAVKANPGDGAAQLILGVAQLDAGRPALALSPLRKAVQLVPGDPECHFQLGPRPAASRRARCGHRGLHPLPVAAARSCRRLSAAGCDPAGGRCNGAGPGLPATGPAVRSGRRPLGLQSGRTGPGRRRRKRGHRPLLPGRGRRSQARRRPHQHGQHRAGPRQAAAGRQELPSGSGGRARKRHRPFQPRAGP